MVFVANCHIVSRGAVPIVKVSRTKEKQAKMNQTNQNFRLIPDREDKYSPRGFNVILEMSCYRQVKSYTEPSKLLTF